ncbi:MAG: IS110 family transposase [Desulfovibrio sp.]|nr:IS110 family transposase [Desulfovibrio sp.]
MRQVCTIGLDIAKNKFQVHGEDSQGQKVFSKQLSRSSVSPFFANLPVCLVGLEACGGAHYWAREIRKLGHDVRLIPPRQVKPFVINNKTDAADAQAICEVVRRPATKFVQIKSVEQQHLAGLHRVRERYVCNRTALVNQIRGLLQEEGVILPQGITHIRKELPAILAEENTNLIVASRTLFENLLNELRMWDEKIEEIEGRLKQMAKADANCTRLLKIPGVGLLTATAIVAHFGDAKQFKNGRQFAACLGLTPREYSSGGKQKLLGISKRGNTYLRKLLIQGARILCTWWGRTIATPDQWRKIWLQQVILRRGKFVAAVGQANKTARIIWNVLAKGVEYSMAMPQ